jgi:hypothetical protein
MVIVMQMGDMERRSWRGLRDGPSIEIEVADLPQRVEALWCRDPETGVEVVLISRTLCPSRHVEAVAEVLAARSPEG